MKTIRVDGSVMGWNGSDENGRSLSPGVYLVYLSDEQGHRLQVKKLIIQP